MPLIDFDMGAHICLRVRNIDAVNQFHDIAIASGGYDFGKPGLRQATMVDYYAAFIKDFDGNVIEAMNVAKDKCL